MKIRVWDTRGLIPTAGPSTVRYGGNTACVTVITTSGHLIILDMGTGLFHVGNRLMNIVDETDGIDAFADATAAGDFKNGSGNAAILLSNTHWEHVQGLGFFAPVFVSGNQFRIIGPGSSSNALESILEGQMNPNFSPIQSLGNLGAAFSIEAMLAGTALHIGSATVTAVEHKRGAHSLLSYRIEDNGHSVVYATDVGYDTPPPEVLALYQNADVLIHDATFSRSDQNLRDSYGYASVAQAAHAAHMAHAKTLWLCHFHPDYSDLDIDAMLADCRQILASCGATAQAEAAYEGLTKTWP